jgi:hypothetical protein
VAILTVSRTLTNEQRRQAKADAQAAIDLATRDFERGAISEADWNRRVTDALAAAYLCRRTEAVFSCGESCAISSSQVGV